MRGKMKAKTAKPKALVGKHKLPEGATPPSSLPTAKRAGGAKSRDKRLMKQAV